MKLKSLFLFATLRFLCTPALADPIIIDFEWVTVDPSTEYVWTETYSEDGFTLSRDPRSVAPDPPFEDTGIVGPDRGISPRGSNTFWWLADPNPPLVLVLKQDNDEPFSFKSVVFGNVRSRDIRPIEINGFLSGGGTVFQVIDPTEAWTKYDIDPSFTNLLYVTFNLHPIPPEFPDMPVLGRPSMDDLVLCSVPEPSTLILLNGGLGLVALFRKRLG